MREAAIGHNELANALAGLRGPAEALVELDRGLALARRCGLHEMEVFIESSGRTELFYDLGRWDELVASSAALLAPEREDVDPQSRLLCRVVAGDVAVWRGQLEASEAVLRGLGDEVLVTGEAQLVVSALDVVAHHFVASGDRDQAERLLLELEAFPNTRDAWNYPSYLPEIVRIACSVLDADFAERFTVGIPPSAMERTGVSLTMAQAELAEARERSEEAAELYTSAAEGFRIFSVPERAQALLGRGRCLLELGDPAAEAVLRRSREGFASLKANRFLPDVDALLEHALRLSS
jgi:hypothetical protein